MTQLAKKSFWAGHKTSVEVESGGGYETTLTGGASPAGSCDTLLDTAGSANEVMKVLKGDEVNGWDALMGGETLFSGIDQGTAGHLGVPSTRHGRQTQATTSTQSRAKHCFFQVTSHHGFVLRGQTCRESSCKGENMKLTDTPSSWVSLPVH